VFGDEARLEAAHQGAQALDVACVEGIGDPSDMPHRAG
jgi:hypothetical protein